MIKFLNYNLETYLQGYLKKINIDENDLNNVKSININSFDLGGKYISNSLEDLKLFKNLESLYISNFILNRENIDTKKMNFSCNLLKFYECSNIENSNIKYNTIEEFTKETE